MKKQERGITLIALVVTIVVLLILAGVSISMLTGDNGIITQAQEAKNKNNHATVSENLKFKILDKYAEDKMMPADEELLAFLRENGYIDDNNVVNVEATTGEKLSTGNGNDNNDIYYIKEGNLYYINKNGVEEKIDYLFEETKYPEEEYFKFDPDTGTISAKESNFYLDINKIDYSSTELVIPSTFKGQKVKRIGIMAYRNIKSVIIPEGVEIIGVDAFNSFNRVNDLTVDMPKSITYIEPYAFAYIKSLTINYRGSQDDWNKIEGKENWVNTKFNITYNYSK